MIFVAVTRGNFRSKAALRIVDGCLGLSTGDETTRVSRQRAEMRGMCDRSGDVTMAMRHFGWQRSSI